MGKTNFAAISRVQVREAESIFHARRSIADIAEDCALEALRVLHDGLSNPDDKLRCNCANILLNAHVKLATLKVAPNAAPQLPPEQRVQMLTAALDSPDQDLSEALRLAGYTKVE